MNPDKILITGQEGMVGIAVFRLLKKKNFKIIQCKRKDLDFLNQNQVDKWFKLNRPKIVINAAGKVGGILDNSAYPSDYIYQNTIIGFNIINSSLRHGVKKLINLGSVSSYPKKTKLPIKENYLLSSSLEQSNEAYAISKIATIKYCEYIKKNYKKDYISLQPANLYGVGDKFNLISSHVIPALIKKFHEAKISKKKSVEVWGSGRSEREFLNVEDMASAILFCLKKKIKFNCLNVGTSDCVSILKLAKMIKKITNYNGNIIFNKKYPEGTLKRKLDTKLMTNLGWRAQIPLEKGLKKYYKYFQQTIKK